MSRYYESISGEGGRAKEGKKEMEREGKRARERTEKRNSML